MTNTEDVKAYEKRQKEKGLTKSKAWIPNTEKDRKSFLDYAKQLRDNFFNKKEEGNDDSTRTN